MKSSSLIAWMIILTLSLSLMIITAAAKMPELHMALSAMIGIAFAVLAVREHKQLRESGANKSAVGASTARYMGLVWVWGALSLLVTYMFILQWREWLTFFLAFAALGGLCLFIAATLERDAQTGKEDPTLLKIGRAMSWVLFAGMLITMIGLIVDGKMARFLNATKYGDWAANHICFFGAFALACISLNALLHSKPVQSA